MLIDTPPEADGIASAAAAAADLTLIPCRPSALDLDAVAATGGPGAFFRPSQAQHATPLVRRAAGAAGYPTVLSYDVDSLDYTDPPTTTVVNATLSAVRGGSIVSMHFGHAVTIAALGPILDGLHRRGLHTATMSELVAG